MIKHGIPVPVPVRPSPSPLPPTNIYRGMRGNKLDIPVKDQKTQFYGILIGIIKL